MKKLLSRVLNNCGQLTMRFLPNTLCVGSLAFGLIATAELGNTYFLVGLTNYDNMNSDAINEVLTDEFPDHIAFVGESCIRYCSVRVSSLFGVSSSFGGSSSSLGIGYSVTDRFALELSWMKGPEVRSTVVQEGNPRWHRTKNKISSLKADFVVTSPLSENFSVLGKAGLQFYSTSVSYSTFTGDGGPENLLGSKTSSSSNDLTANLSGGLWFVPDAKLAFGVNLSYYIGQDFSYESSVQLQMKIRPW